MITRWSIIGGLLFATIISSSRGADSVAADQIHKIYQHALTDTATYDQLTELTTRFPGRLAGSKNLEGAIPWGEKILRDLGCDSVRLQPVMVPHWERGAPESVKLLGTSASDPAINLTATALGWSAATPSGGLHALVIEVQSLDEVAKLGREKIAGKIVFFNRPMDLATLPPGEAYRVAGDQRNRGPAEAAKYGAVAALTRSLTQRVDDIPHTGYTGFPPDQPKIPAAALSLVAANRLSQALKENPDREVAIEINAKVLPDAQSYNVIAEIKGSEEPNKIILVGGHLDSWDIAPGAHDDGAGIVQSVAVLRTFKALGIHPRHTLRCVLFVAEENSTAGAIEYARVAKEKNEVHILAIESDAGGFEPRGFNIGNVSFPAHERASRWKNLFEPYGIYFFVKGSGGSDVGPLMVQGTTVGETLPNSQRYFDYHHTRIDSIDAVNQRELQLGAAAITSLVWLVDTEGL